MTYLEQLLGGAAVDWRPLGEVCKRTRGTHITALRMRELHKENAPVKVFAGGKTVAYLNYEDLPAEDIQNTPSIIVKSRGIIEFEYYDGPFSHKNEFWAYHSENRDINIKFIYYFLKTQEPRLRRKAETMGTIPQIALPDTERLLIPVPPLAVQERIVEILDKFTALIEALETELALRTQQYEYYRNKLLRFDKEVAWKPLGEIGKVCMCRRIFREQTTPKGDIPFYKIGTFGREADAYISYELYEEYRRRYPFPKMGDVLISASGTIGRLVIYDGAPAYFQDSNIVWIDNDESLFLNRFLYYYYGIVTWKTDKGTIERLYNRNLEKVPIPLPPLAVQEQIVAILDKFHTLVHSISEGLPAEIALRRRQYEYYRNLLLRFPKP